MKRIFILFFLFTLVQPVSLWADEVLNITEDREIRTLRFDKEKVQGKLKAGLSLGYPSGVTAGYSFSNFFELNGTVGSDFESFTTGVNGLFSLVNFDISGEIFSLSAGPAVNAHFKRNFALDTLALVRLEYTFRKIPLNLFIEGGLGLRVIEFADMAGSAALGARYVF